MITFQVQEEYNIYLLDLVFTRLHKTKSHILKYWREGWKGGGIKGSNSSKKMMHLSPLRSCLKKWKEKYDVFDVFQICISFID